MKIAKYIGDLLFEYECIVIPGFGGFITSETPAQINPNQHSFAPPTKKIVFNAHLKINDGLLINHMAEKEKITFKEAKVKVEIFVNKCNKALDQGRRIHFHRIGILQKDKSQYLVFEPDTAYNYQADSFGLSTFISPPIKRETGLRLDKKNKDRKPDRTRAAGQGQIKQGTQRTTIKTEPDNKPARYLTINLFAVFVVIGLVALAYFNFGSLQKFYNNYSSVIPLFYSTPNEYIAVNLAEKPLSGIILPRISHNSGTTQQTPPATTKPVEASLINIDDSTQPIAENNPANRSTNNEPPTIPKTRDISSIASSIPPAEETIAPPKSNPENQRFQFYIIAGSFTSEANARKLAEQLVFRGFDAAVIGRNRYGHYRVCYAGFQGRSEAERELAVIRKNENPSAWIYSE